MASKFLKIHTDGLPKEEEGLVVSAGAGDSGKLVALDASGKLDESVLPVGIGADVKVANAGENLAAGDFVYIDASGDVRKADASNTAKLAIGFVLSAVTAASDATVYMEGTNTGLTGLTAGTRYFLSPSSPGTHTATVPTTAGHTVQVLGTAIDTTELSFEPQIIGTRA